MSHTKDDNKKKKDNNAINKMKNELREKNAEHGKHKYSKKNDHL